jgi:hypothetical protein
MILFTRIEVVNGQPSDPSCEAFVEPELTPPVHSDEVAEPLVSKLVGYDIGHSVSVAVRGGLLVEKNSSSPRIGSGS